MGVTLGRVDVIVTGAGGLVGRILQAGWGDGTDYGLQLHWTGRGKGLPLHWDIGMTAPPPLLPQGAVVLHLAGVTRGRAEAFRANAELMPPVLDLCRVLSARRLVVMSSAAVYAPGALMHEQSATAPASPYGQSKAKAESLALTQTHTPVTLLRAGNIAGADALLGPRPLGEIILEPAAGQQGGPLRSWMGAKVMTEALASLCSLDLPEVLNLAQDPPQPMADLLKAAALPWRYGGIQAAVPVATQDLSRLHALLPLAPATPSQLAEEARWARDLLARGRVPQGEAA